MTRFMIKYARFIFFMRLRRLKHLFLRLSSEEKVTFIGTLLVLVGSFMPWYQVKLTVDEGRRVIENGFSGDLGVLGLVVFLVSLLGLLVLTGEHLGFRLPTFGYQKERVVLFLMGQSAFLLLLLIAIYTKRSFDFTDAELRFGLYMAFIGAILATLSAWALIQKLKRRETEAFFKHEEEVKLEAPTEEEEEAFEKAVAQAGKEEEMIEEGVEEVQMSLSGISEVEELQVEAEVEEPAPAEEPAEEPIEMIEASEEEIEEEKKEEKKKETGDSFGFYED